VLDRLPEAFATLDEAEALRDLLNPWDTGLHLDHLAMRARVARTARDYTSAERDLRLVLATLESGRISPRPAHSSYTPPWPFPDRPVDVMETLARVLFLDGRIDESRQLESEIFRIATTEMDSESLRRFLGHAAIRRWRIGDYASAASTFDAVERLMTDAGVAIPIEWIGPAAESRERGRP